ncbi:DNA polymerase III subunit epsilon [Solilutibacter tolerans]|uniref:DNA polymerase III subunit epsilon n=1 Tax=Solilutibacter tolerans TaxID=1604334 RepID=A0A1N6VF55_9GAMM|nr:DNA polymerase III subunit epsilon [Lysobacter tolerans]SIQ76358.1 DNA polymerase III, epsilon subunit [Lysobacter tolerans]
MRQIVLDTETTGLEWRKGNRVVEIGCVELIERRPTGNHFHHYLNPDREFEQGAQEVTGLTTEFLADKPRFENVVDEFLDYIDGAELIIHNASFDIGFLDNELSLVGASRGRISDRATVTDTLEMARHRYPGQRNSLDALCRRLGVDNAHRQLHGALLDAQLLADVYLAMTSGQSEIGFDALTAEADANQADAAAEALAAQVAASGPRPRVIVSGDERTAHEARLDAIGKKLDDKPVLWRVLAS